MVFVYPLPCWAPSEEFYWPHLLMFFKAPCNCSLFSCQYSLQWAGFCLPLRGCTGLGLFPLLLYSTWLCALCLYKVAGRRKPHKREQCVCHISPISLKSWTTYQTSTALGEVTVMESARPALQDMNIRQCFENDQLSCCTYIPQRTCPTFAVIPGQLLFTMENADSASS